MLDGGKTNANAPGATRAKKDGPRRMPAAVSPITPGWWKRLSKAASSRPERTITMIWRRVGLLASLAAAALMAVGGCADGGARMADGGWRMADGGARRADGGAQRADGGAQRADGGARRAEGRGRRRRLPSAKPPSAKPPSAKPPTAQRSRSFLSIGTQRFA